MTGSPSVAGIVRQQLEELLADDVVDRLTRRIAEALDAAGIIAVLDADLANIQARNRCYRTALLQIAHALDVAQEDPGA